METKRQQKFGRQIQKDLSDIFQKEFKDYISGDAFKTGDLALTSEEVTDLLRVTIEYKQVVTDKGVLSATYLPFITFQDKYTNRVTDRAREVAVKKLMETFFKKIGAGELASMEGSSSLRDKMIATAIAPLVSVKIKGATVKVDPKIDPKKIKNQNRTFLGSSYVIKKGGRIEKI